MEIALMISVVINVIFLIVLFISLRAYQNLEKTVEEERSYFYQFFEDAWKRILEIDTRGSFATDDEVGWFYTELKKTLDVLYKKISRYL